MSHCTCIYQNIDIYTVLFTHQQKKWSAQHPACFEVKQHFAAPGRAVRDHIKYVLTKLVDSYESSSLKRCILGTSKIIGTTGHDKKKTLDIFAFVK